MKKYSIVLRVHGIVLLCMGILMTVQTLLGCFKGIGVLSFIHGDLLRSVGLFEAYLLAGFCGAVFMLLSGKYYSKEWHLLAATVHLILGVTNLIFWRAYSLAGIVVIGYISTTAHISLLLIESTFYLKLKAKYLS